MKKFTLFFALFAFCFNGISAQQIKQYLRTVQAQKEPNEFFSFYYDDENRLDSIIWSMMETETKVAHGYRKLYRDDIGNVILRNWYQTIDFVSNQTSKIEYQYNDKNQLITRKNYNNYGYGLIPQGHYSYEYNDDGTLHLMKKYDAWEETKEIGHTDYVYENGKLIEEIDYGPDLSIGAEDGAIILQQKITYSYYDDGKINTVVTLIRNQTGELYENEKAIYTYDEYGNLVSKKNFLNKGGWQPAVELKYSYDLKYDADEIVYPIDNDIYEPTYAEVYEMANNRIIEEEKWSEFEGDWALFDTYEYVYENVPGASVSEVKDIDSNLIVVNDKGVIYLSGVKDGEIVYIYDVNGNLLVASTYVQGGLTVAGLPNGIKIVKVANRTAKFM